MNVELKIEDHVATVTLSRPESLNAVDSATAEELQAIWLQLEADTDVRCIVLTGSGERAFCVGADLKEPGRHGLDYWAHPTPGGFGGIALRESLDIPVIARVNGYALGGLSREWAMCRSMAAPCCCRGRSRSVRRWGYC
jgi:enoyl-CoA hydratase/carnithine racemase